MKMPLTLTKLRISHRIKNNLSCMKEVFGYIRVSTARQGEHGVSLAEQKDAIERYAAHNNLSIIEWFEERETAAKRGRAVFTQMITKLLNGHSAGVVIHKIDRSARNLRDWADLVDLADQGVEIHFANESVDLQVRGGRLSADIQAVVAADYVRNLREESMKGMRGRLKQGLYPWGAPLGYIDKGGGKVKEIDPVKGPVIQEIFNKYASGMYSHKSLLTYANKVGLTNKRERKLSRNGIATILHNPFYTGVIYVKSMDEIFLGKHEPLISQDVFNRVQDVLAGKSVSGNTHHKYRFRRLFNCIGCNRSLIGERQKGRVYYRCHQCPGVCVREDTISETVDTVLKPFKLCEHEEREVEKVIQHLRRDNAQTLEAERKSLRLQLDATDARLSKLTDAFLDEVIEKPVFLQKKTELVTQQKVLQQSLTETDHGVSRMQKETEKTLELFKNAYISYFHPKSPNPRGVLNELTSNRSVHGKSIAIELYPALKALVDIKKSSSCPHCRAQPRTSSKESSVDLPLNTLLFNWGVTNSG